MNAKNIISQCEAYFSQLRSGESYEFKPFLGAKACTLYSSVFAVMSYHYSGKLKTLSAQEKSEWQLFINSHQNEETGLYDSHELHGEIGEYHNLQHRRLHLTCHVLPALALLGAIPRYPIKYIENYLDRDKFAQWLDARDLSMAWVEGNNLFFAGQLLIHEIETSNRGHESLEQLFLWLEKTVDSNTGLWGTDQGCNLHKAMYGAYHQLILYFYRKRPVPYMEKLIDSVLACQHFDGGFSEWRGGGTCQDIDGIDILVNCYKLTNYRSRDIRRSLRKSLIHILDDRLIASGGFQDREGHEFIHNSMVLTRTPKTTANSFSTWFTLHALVDIGSVLDRDRFFSGIEFYFNDTCSMGWGPKAGHTVVYSKVESIYDYWVFRCKRIAVKIYDLLKR